MHRLTQKIATLQRQLTYRQYATAACWTAAAILATAIALSIADYVVRFRDPGLRIMATTTLTAVTVWAVYRWWYRPGRQRLVSLTVARRVETHFPQLNDSLASALEFLQQSEEDRTAGSAQLRRLVVAQAETAVEGLPLDDVIDRRPLRRASIGLGVAGIALVACLAWDAGAVRTALARLAVPLGSTQWPRQHHLAFRDPPTRLAAGQTFEAELVNTAGSLPDEVRIEYRISQGSHREKLFEPMTRVGDMMVARRENVRQSFAFRATGGDDDLMPWLWVEVIEPPQLKSLEVTVHPPDYSGLPPTTAQRHLDVLAGTHIELRGTATEPLDSARILQDGQPPINATIAIGDSGSKPGGFRVAPENWLPTRSGSYSLELSDTDGLAGVVGQWNLRVEPDPPPSISWQSPSDDLYVTPRAVIPIELVVKDNLGIHRVDVAYDRSDWSEAEREAAAARIELYRGPDKAVPQTTEAGESKSHGESRVVEYFWDLAPLQLPVGAGVSIMAEAADYRPGVGRTVGPRRITIITPDELDARMAERQAQIVRQLERALAAERTTRDDIRRIQIQLRDAGALTGGDRNTLQSAEMNQRRVGRMLVDPMEGVPALVDALVRDLEINRVSESDIRDTMDLLTAEIERLSTGPLDTADRELTASRKSVDVVAPRADNSADGNQSNPNEEMSQTLSRSLAAAGAAQDDVIATLERLVSDLSGKAEYRRFARMLAELREDQIAHAQATRADIGVKTLPLRTSELTRALRASLHKAAAGESAIAARFEKIEQDMDRLAQELTQNKAEGADTVTEALELARSLAIGAKMNETARDLRENRVGGALARELQIAADLQQVIDVLRGIDERRPEQLAAKLRAAEDRLDTLREQLAALRQQISQAEEQPAGAANAEKLQSLNQKQQDLRREIEKLAGQLDRLQASDASQSTQNAAERLDDRSQELNQSPRNQQRPSPSHQVEKAEKHLDEAAKQLTERRQQAEDDLALEIVRRFQTQLTDMVKRQKKVIEETVKLHDSRPPNEPLSQNDVERAAKLAAEERELAEIAKEHSELLFGLGAVRVSLEEAERRLAASAALLDEQETGPSAQQAEQRALARLEGMMNAFAQTATEAAPEQPAQPNAGTGAGGEQPQRRPTFELLEVKMLRMLQVDLQARTREHQQRIGGLDAPLDQRQRTNLEREAQELAAEQGRLAELVQHMLTRDNEEGEQ
ncbi:MAG: hypothetical protein L0228_16225 [Planctomycetes bacterium]|nr:hypothetical protein [Planctomycetota bacterium]